MNAGARINRLFHNKFPKELGRITFDKVKLYKEISFAIWNNEAVKTSLFTPHAAFEAVVRGQIQRILDPSYRCVDAVLLEVLGAIHKCSQKIQRYPALREECERISVQTAKECEQNCKKQIDLFVEMQLAYINVNHKDFVGFQEASEKVDAAPTKKGNVNQVLAKGYLTLHNVSFLKGGAKDAWFVLTSENLSWYADEREENKKFSLPTSGLKYRDLDKSRSMFALFSSDGRNVYNDYKQLELSGSSVDQKEAWKEAFSLAGVVSDGSSSSSTPMAAQKSRSNVIFFHLN